MHIPSYQIHNVLNVYRRQLSQGKPQPAGPKSDVSENRDTINISAKGKKKSIMDKVATDIINKISTYGPEGNQRESDSNRSVKKDLSTTANNSKPGKHKFEYNLIDQNNRKVTSAISMEDSSGLIGRLDQLARQAADKPDAKR